MRSNHKAVDQGPPPGWSDEDARYIADRYLSMMAAECQNIGDVWAFNEALKRAARQEIERLSHKVIDR